MTLYPQCGVQVLENMSVLFIHNRNRYVLTPIYIESYRNIFSHSKRKPFFSKVYNASSIPSPPSYCPSCLLWPLLLLLLSNIFYKNSQIAALKLRYFCTFVIPLFSPFSTKLSIFTREKAVNAFTSQGWKNNKKSIYVSVFLTDYKMSK